MGYRFSDIKPPKPDDLLPVFDMHNNELRMWSFPCFYFDVEKPIDWHDYKMHDFMGWPQPTRPGHICQMVPDYNKPSFSPSSVWDYVDMSKAIRIDLSSEYEGYYDVEVTFDPTNDDGDDDQLSDMTEYITAGGSIRRDEPWIVDVNFSSSLPSFGGEPVERIFNVFLISTDRKDMLVRGKLLVYPG